MAVSTRNIGLSLGADICWPLAFEEILDRSRLQVKVGAETVRFAVERMALQPFSLTEKCKYDLVVDRLTHWFPLRREWIKKAVLMDGLYVFNNPWSVQSYEKHSTYCAMMALGMPIPATVMAPQKRYEPKADLEFTLQSYARLFDLAALGREVGYPLFMKPFDGGGWQGVSMVKDEPGLTAAYDGSDRHLMHLQAAVKGYDLFVRAVGIGPQVRLMKYDPDQPLHARYLPDRDFCSAEDQAVMEDTCLLINSYFGWDFNSCEALRKDGVFHPIDFANPCPDSQVNSIHRHWPWYVLSNLRWALFVAATRRPMRQTLDFAPFQAIAKQELPYREKLRQYGKVARQRFDKDRFDEFCAGQLKPLVGATVEWLGGESCRAAIRRKVAHIFPAHEVDEFSERFWQQVQVGREELAGQA